MKWIRSIMVLVMGAPFLCGASKEMVELQRDVAMLQDQVRTLQRALDEKTSILQTLLQQTLDQTNKSNTAIAVLQSNFRETLQEQQRSVAAPIAGVGSRVDQMAEEFRAVREAVLDMSSRMAKLDAKVTDVQNALNVIRNPPSAPPPSAAGGALAAGGAPPAGMSVEATYTNAFKDFTGGNYDIAYQEFSDCVKYFPTAELASNCQFYIGDIYYRKKDFAHAIEAYDAVLEHYPDGNKTADAHLMKGLSLVQEGKRDAAAREFRDVVGRYPDSEAAAKAKAQLKGLGLSPAAPAATPAKPRTKRR
jgi:tol-pal system protein YbgF